MAKIVTGSISLSLSSVPAMATSASLSTTQIATGGYGYYAITSFPISVWTSVYLGAITQDLGYVFFKNGSSTNYVEVAIDSGGTKIVSKIPPLKFTFLCAHGGTAAYWIRANTASCLVTVWAAQL